MTTSETIDPALIAEIAAAVRAVPGVRDAEAVVRQSTRNTASTTKPAAPPPLPSPSIVEPGPRNDTDDIAEPSSELDGGELRIPAGAALTLQDALRQAAESAPDKGTIFLTRDGGETLQTYPELLHEAECVLGGLRAAGLRSGEAALFQFDDNRGYLTAFWACVLGGFVPTPVAVATTYQSPNETNRKLHSAWELLGYPVLLTDTATAPALAGVRQLWNAPEVRILTMEELGACPADTDWYSTVPDSPVFNLLTSGSTGTPKCVQHTNASVAARTWSAAQARGYDADEVTVNWMPLDHVAIVFYNIRDVFLRCLHVNARIDHFLGDPLVWLDWLDRYQATNTWAPNFAFALVNEHAEEIAHRHWNLSRVREFVNGGEPVIAETSHRFLDLLAPHGLPADAMKPAWGMSETCSGVTYSSQCRDDPAAGIVVVTQSSLDGRLRYADTDHREAVTFSTLGGPIPGVMIRVVDAEGAVLPQDRVGELQIRGGTMMSGYHNNAEANRDSYDPDGWFRTGDLAFVHDGEVVIAGRKKDQIIVRGINYVAHELENVVERVDGVRVTFSAAAGVREPGEGSDQLVVFVVPTRWDADSLDRTLRDVRATLVREAGLAPDLVVPVTEEEFPKTTSGKIQRGALVADLRVGRFADRITGPENTASPDTWLCLRQWSTLPEPAGGDTGAGGVPLVFTEDDLLPRLGFEGTVATVGRGQRFAEEAPERFRVVPGDVEGIRRALARVTALHGPVDTVVFAWPLPAEAETTDPETTDPATRLAHVTAQLTALIQALAGGEFGRPFLLVLTAGSVHVRPGDQVDLGVCALPGLVRTAIAEAALPVIRQLDLPADQEQWANAVRVELADRSHAGVVAARGNQRWQPRLRPVAESEADTTSSIIAGGLYLITGGLGGIAHDLASYLLATYGVHLLLVGRSPAEGEKATRLAELADLGEVTYHQADVADELTLHQVVTDAERRWGRPLDGVLHLASADPIPQWAEAERHTLSQETPDTFAEQYWAKVSGTLAIAAVLESRPETSLLLFGSVVGEFGGHSFGATAATNTFLVGFADYWHHERGRNVRCLAWSMWTDIGMNRDQPIGPPQQRGFRPVTPEIGLRSFLAATGTRHHYILIGLDLAHPAILAELEPAELHPHEILVAYTATDTDPADVPTALEPILRRCPVPVRLMELTRIPTGADGAPDTTQLLLDATPRHPGRRRFTAPATDLERRIASTWSDVLNRPTISRDDSFFELGGNSLRATRILVRISEELTIHLTVNKLYENPTIAALAETIANSRGRDG